MIERNNTNAVAEMMMIATKSLEVKRNQSIVTTMTMTTKIKRNTANIVAGKIGRKANIMITHSDKRQPNSITKT